MNNIKYNNKVIEYKIVKSKIKNVYIHIKDGQVIVKAPIKVKEKELEKIVESKKEWIYKKLEEKRIRDNKKEGSIKLLGKKYPLKINLVKQDISNIYIEDGIMIIEIPETYKKQYIEISKQMIDDMYLKVAEKEVDMAMQIVTRIVGIKPNKYRVKKIKTAWGTCTSNNNITINSELMKYDRKVIQYVVLHEVCHLRYMNHSKDFWNMVEKYMNDYKEVRKMLKSNKVE